MKMRSPWSHPYTDHMCGPKVGDEAVFCCHPVLPAHYRRVWSHARPGDVHRVVELVQLHTHADDGCVVDVDFRRHDRRIIWPSPYTWTARVTSPTPHLQHHPSANNIMPCIRPS